VLNHLEDEKRAIAVQVQANVDRAVSPLVRRLRQTLVGKHEERQLALIQRALDDVTAPFLNRLESLYAALTQREIEVANMIRNGMSSKEIAEGLGVSVYTVHNLRARMRRKLRLSGGRQGLGEFLRSL
jgi:DNA-binding CsgD family transcriptional regulator